MSQRKTTFLNIVKAAFFICFVGFSYESLRDYVRGHVIYDIINDYNSHLVYPSVTLCPKKEDELTHVNLDKLAQSFPHLRSMLSSYNVYFAFKMLQEPFEVVKNYSFSFNETVLGSRIFGAFSSNGTFVSPEIFDEAMNNYTKELANSANMFSTPDIPIALKEINDFNGRCFNFQTREMATLEPQSKGNSF